MQHDPYQPPSSGVRPPGKNRSNTVGWKALFWIMAVLTYFGISGLPKLTALTPFDLIDLVLTCMTLGGIFGFAYYRPLIGVVFWRYFFYAVLIDVFILSVIFPVFGIPRYGRVAEFGFEYLLELAFSGVILYALHSYAYRCPFVWQQPPNGGSVNE